MLPIDKLLEYQKKIVLLLLDQNNNRIFNHEDMVVDDSELATILKELPEDKSTMLISVLPEFYIQGEEDNIKYQNILEFFILDKTTYADKDRATYLNIFVETQQKAQLFINKLLDDKQNHKGVFCGMLSWLKEDSIAITPVWKKQGCNGWSIQISLDT